MKNLLIAAAMAAAFASPALAQSAKELEAAATVGKIAGLTELYKTGQNPCGAENIDLGRTSAQLSTMLNSPKLIAELHWHRNATIKAGSVLNAELCGYIIAEAVKLGLLNKKEEAPKSEPESKPEVIERPKPIRVTASALSTGSTKHLGKTYIVTLNCLYADDNDYRCFSLGSTNLRIDSKSLEDESGQEYIEKNCGDNAKAAAPRCTFDVTFTFASRSQQQQNNGHYFTFVTPEFEEMIIVPVKARKRK